MSIPRVPKCAKQTLSGEYAATRTTCRRWMTAIVIAIPGLIYLLISGDCWCSVSQAPTYSGHASCTVVMWCYYST